MASRGLPFTFRNYMTVAKNRLHSWDAVRRALGDPDTGEPASIRTLRVYAGQPVAVYEESWEDHLSRIVDDVGPVTTRMYDDIRPKGAPNAETLSARSGMSWREMIDAVSDTRSSGGKVDWVDALIVMMDRHDTDDLDEELYSAEKDWNMPSSATIVKKAGSWRNALGTALEEIDGTDADEEIDAWLAKNKD